MLAAELESVAHGPLTEAGAVSILRWHALSGYSLELTQFTGGRVTIDGGTGALLAAIADAAAFDRRLATPVAAVVRHDGQVEVHTRDGEVFIAGAAIVAVALNALGGIEFSPPLPEDKQRAIELGQASRGIKVMIHARGEDVIQNSIRFRHPFGYLGSEIAARRRDAADDRLRRRRRALRPGRPRRDAGQPRRDPARLRGPGRHGARLARPTSSRCGTWAIHRPGWYEHHHAAMRRPEGNVILAGSDLANGWAGFIDGAIESGLQAGAWAARR